MINTHRRLFIVAMTLAATAAGAAQVGVRPGGERWKVRIGTDADAAKVAVYVLPRTVEQLRAMPRAGRSLPAEARVAGPELRRFVTRGTLTAYAVAADGSYRLKIAGASGKTILAEIPRLEFIPNNNAWHREIAIARARFQDRFKLREDATTVNTAWQPVTADLRLVGVGHYHGREAGSPNGLMLAPVLSIVWTGS